MQNPPPPVGPISSSSSSSSSSCGSFDLLSDDLVVNIGFWVAKAAGTKNLCQLQKTCHRIRTILVKEEFIQSVIRQQLETAVVATNNPASTTNTNNNTNGIVVAAITTLEQLGLYEMIVNESDLLQENRLGFEFGSLEMDDNDGEASGIKGSWDRIRSVQKIVQKFSNTTFVRIDSHCGIAAPASIAGRFAQARGMSVVYALSRNNNNDDDDVDVVDYNYDPINNEVQSELRSWGMRIARKVSELDHHPFNLHAKSGKGWVEIFICLRDSNIELPSRAAYYQD